MVTSNTAPWAVVVAALFLIFLSAPAVAQVSDGVTDGTESHVTVYGIHVNETGNATWTVELRRQLEDADALEAFRSFRSNFEAGNVTVFEGIEGDMRPLVNEAENSTGRGMSAVGFERDVGIQNTVTGATGITRVSFTWTNFAGREGGNLVVGDIFVGSGLTIGANERLVMTYDDALSVENVAPQPDVRDAKTLQWNGQHFFEAGHPHVVFSNGGGGFGVPLGIPTASLVAGLLVLVSGFFGGIYMGRRMGILRRDGNEETVENEVDEELLTDEDKIVRLLEQNEGRMKQAEIVESTGWSKSKVSMVLSDMEEKDVISKLRLGRENVIDLEKE